MLFKKRAKKPPLKNKLLKLAMGTTPGQLKKGISQRQLIAKESKIGRQLFGPVPKGHHREFFCLDEKTWIWHEEWTENGKTQERTTRYEIHPNAIVKIQDNQPYQELQGQELQNFVTAIHHYALQISKDVYNKPLSVQGDEKQSN